MTQNPGSIFLNDFDQIKSLLGLQLSFYFDASMDHIESIGIAGDRMDLLEDWKMKALAQISTDQFKSVMKRFAATVNVITSADGESMSGMTATAVCSVSADPPSVLIIVNRTNRSHPVIRASKAFAINVLSAEQIYLATHFASKASDPFSTVDYSFGQTGCPLLKGADAHLECVVVNEMDSGSHTIFVGQIVSSHVENREPLLYHAGRFRAFETSQMAAA